MGDSEIKHYKMAEHCEWTAALPNLRKGDNDDWLFVIN
jgi:hypothetical protein